jgi:hypothetical protein
MGDLEELIFTRNIPGKYSRWDEEDDDFNQSEQIDSGEEENVEFDEFHAQLVKIMSSCKYS